ncbi:MAG: hypothetical protein J6U20_03010 [Fibrobacter sp.]|nr:hypothetical protein [Fibrobacter sp.]
MSEMHIGCPHCGASFDVQFEGEISNMMVFPCVKCNVPLMYFHGEISELDREEFALLRKRLSKVLNVVMKHGDSVNDVAESLKKMVDASDERASEREKNRLPSLSDDTLAQLQKSLDEMDADSFLDSL